MMKRKTWLTIGIAALLLFCTAVLAEGANRNVPLDSALDAALNAPGSGIAFANGSAYPWQVVEIDGGKERQRGRSLFKQRGFGTGHDCGRAEPFL